MLVQKWNMLTVWRGLQAAADNAGGGVSTEIAGRERVGVNGSDFACRVYIQHAHELEAETWLRSDCCVHLITGHTVTISTRIYTVTDTISDNVRLPQRKC